MTILGQKLTSEPVLWSRVYRVLMSPLWVKSPLVGLITRLPSFKLPELRVRKGSFHKKPGDLMRRNSVFWKGKIKDYRTHHP